jgi:hypothetical protein
MMSTIKSPPKPVARALWCLAVYAATKTVIMGLSVERQWSNGSWKVAQEQLGEQYPALANLLSILVLTVFGAFVGFYMLSIRKLRSGRNWARQLVLVVFLAKLIFDLTSLVVGSASEGLVITPALVVRLLLLGLHGYAIFLLFSKSAAGWFRGT